LVILVGGECFWKITKIKNWVRKIEEAQKEFILVVSWTYGISSWG
jgi:hypothetical protein